MGRSLKAGSASLYRKEDYERRLPVENQELYRSEFRRDSARILHSPCFRRLQGKTQLFPGVESDYFRNRLTHSLEVGQVAKSIATRLNHTEASALRNGPIDVDLVEAAGWAHDLGHPPFGHQGEQVLDSLMKGYGGFEGNAQTLRILARLEKRDKGADSDHGFDGDGEDQRFGLNLTARTLAAVLKYDRPIPILRLASSGVSKGYYKSEAAIVKWIKARVAPGVRDRVKTVECQIMDVADDIAYSVYDLEDALKASFLSPLSILSLPRNVIEKVAVGVAKSLEEDFLPGDVEDYLRAVFGPLVVSAVGRRDGLSRLASSHLASEGYCSNGYYRHRLTSHLLGNFIQNVRLIPNRSAPQLSTVKIAEPLNYVVEILKHLTFVSLIESSRVQVASFRADDVLTTIFETLTSERGHRLLPADVLDQWEATDGVSRRRVVCDYIAGMTDRYALEFFGRIRSDKPQTIFKPI